MNDSGLWKRGMLLLVLVAFIAGVALYVAVPRADTPIASAERVCPDFLRLLSTPATSAAAPFPAAVNWGNLYQIAQYAPSPPGWEVRYNAALALARKGYADLPFDTLVEMLDEEQQFLNSAVCKQDGRMGVNEAEARNVVYVTLQVIAQWHQHKDRPKKFDGENADLQNRYEAGLAKVSQAVEKVTQSANNVLRTEAIKTRQILGEQ